MPGVASAMKRSGLTREQIYYLEERGYLGPVARKTPARGTLARRKQAREYTEAQLEKLERIGSCRLLGLRLDEAGPIASAQLSRDPAALQRLRALAVAKMKEIGTELDALMYILTVIEDFEAPGRVA